MARVEQMRVQNENEASDRRRERVTMQKELDALRQRNSALDEQLKSAQQAAMSQSSRVGQEFLASFTSHAIFPPHESV